MMKPVRILVCGHDWGGLNLLVPLLRAWTADSRVTAEFLGAPVMRRTIVSKVPGLTLAPHSNLLTEWLCHRRSELDDLLVRVLESGDYDLVLCSTSAHALIERRLFHVARRSKVPSIAFCDMWSAYTERFYNGEEWTLPDHLWVIDEPMRAAAAAVEWPEPLPISVIGSPLFGELVNRRASLVSSNGTGIRFISEGVSAVYPEARIDEFEFAELVVEAVKLAGLSSPVVIRPHPAESQEPWRRWVFARRGDGVVIETLPLEEAILDTKFAVGITSILLSEMRMCGVPVASLQPAGVDQSYYVLPFDELGIARVADPASLARWFAAPSDRRPPNMAKAHMHAVETATRFVMDVAETAARCIA